MLRPASRPPVRATSCPDAQKADVLVLLREEPQVSVPLRFNAVEIDVHAAAQGGPFHPW
jgi:hypothetical protein